MRKYLTGLLLKFRNTINRHPKTRKVTLCMTLVTKNESDILESFLLFNKKMGVDFFVVTDNGSTDDTSLILKKYQDKGWIIKIFNELCGYEQCRFVNQMNEYIRDNTNANWVINSDTDEFWVSTKSNIKQHLEGVRSNVCFCPSYNVIPISEKFHENTLAIVEPTTSNNPLSIFSRSFQKVIHRVDGYISIDQGNHNVKMRKKSTKYLNDVFILHYPVRNIRQFENKFKNLMAGDLKNVLHVQQFIKLYNKGISIEELYDQYLSKDLIDDYLVNGRIKNMLYVKNFFLN